MPDIVSGGVIDYPYKIEIVSDQYIEISAYLDNLNQELEKANDNIQELEKKVNTQNKTLSGISNVVSDGVVTVSGSVVADSSATAPPEDYYSFMTDTQGQIVFFLSLLLGVMLCYIFTVNFNRK